LGADELQRVAKLELFDEFEEWHMISQHYTYAHSPAQIWRSIYFLMLRSFV
jgi:hypothetical protein